VARLLFALPSLVVFAVLLSVPTLAQLAGPVKPDLSFASPSSAAPPSTCSQAPQNLVVPREILGQARLKARMVTLLRESLYDDAKGVVNVAREKEIRKLASKLKSGKLD